LDRPGDSLRARVDGSDTWGNFELTLREDGQHFDGRWSYCDAPVNGAWNGDRVAGSDEAPKPAGTDAAAAGTSAAPASAGGARPTGDEMRTQAEAFIRQVWATGGSGASDAALYTPEMAELVAGTAARVDRGSLRPIRFACVRTPPA